MSISFEEIAKSVSATTGKAVEIITAPSLIVWFGVAFVLLAVVILAWLWTLETRKSTLIWFETPGDIKIKKMVLSGDKFDAEKGAYKIPETSFSFHDPFFGTSRAYIFMKGISTAFKVYPQKNKLETDAEGLKKLVDNETLKQLLTVHGNAKDLILGIAIGFGVVLLVFFFLVAFKKVAFV